jgi:RNA polymerase-binding transcription factor DksA
MFESVVVLLFTTLRKPLGKCLMERKFRENKKIKRELINKIEVSLERVQTELFSPCYETSPSLNGTRLTLQAK